MAESTLDFESTHTKNALRFELKEYLLLGGGPFNCSERVLRAVGMQPIIPIYEEMYQMMDDTKEMIKYAFQTKNRLTLANQTSGNGGNEAILHNLLDPGDKLVIAIGGTWGEKVLDMAQRYKLDVLPLRKPPGEIYSLEELEEAVTQHKADLLFVTHGESSGGILQKLEGLAPMCHKHNCLLAVDAVVSLAVEPLFVDRWEIDTVCSASQKGLCAPPGLALLTFSARAEERMRNKSTRPPYYFDMLEIGAFWKCFDTPRLMYYYTLSSNLVAALREALAEICEEGLLARWERHRRNTTFFWKKLEEIGLESFVEKEENRFHGITGVKIPEGINEMELIEFLKAKYDISTSPGSGPTFGKATRFGLMGQNSRQEVVEYLAKALKDAFTHFKTCK